MDNSATTSFPMPAYATIALTSWPIASRLMRTWNTRGNFPPSFCRIEIRTKSGKELVARVDYPRGHGGNPMTDEEVWDKFRMLAGRQLNKGQAEWALEVMGAFDTASSLDGLFESVQIRRG
jgi:2-methylcitrate dehydratase PrpD